jgi:uncharacterized cofD-like protein
MKAVAFGGGHGLKASLSALLLAEAEVSAVVVVSDDGGSSGKIRNSYPVLPPGDLRMAFEVLTTNENWAEILGHRFRGKSELTNHAVGNLILLALFEKYQNPELALLEFGKLIQARGRVFPMSLAPLEIVADVELHGVVCEVVGQVAVASSEGEIKTVRLLPENPPVSRAALAAIADAELLVFGPGSWWTSVLPHFLVPQMKEAISQAAAKKIVINNLIGEKGETENFLPTTFLKFLKEVAQDIKFDFVINEIAVTVDELEIEKAVKDLGAENIFADVMAPDSISHPRGSVHDPKKLAMLLDDLRIGGKI